jgi:hypothetical protein
MSGGSWDYLYLKIDEAAGNLLNETSSLRRAFGHHLGLVAAAMHDIEWVDSLDYGEGDDEEAIRAVLGDSAKEKELSVLLADAEDLANKLMEFTEKEV